MGDLLDERVFDYFQLSESDRLLVRDMVRVVAASIQPQDYTRLEAEETVIQVDVEIIATAVADFSLYAWDSIDREEIGLGTTSTSTEETFPASILITFLGPLAGPPEELDIEDVEVVEALTSVNMGEIEMDYGEDDRDDYDQLQLALTAAAV